MHAAIALQNRESFPGAMHCIIARPVVHGTGRCGGRCCRFSLSHRHPVTGMGFPRTQGWEKNAGLPWRLEPLQRPSTPSSLPASEDSPPQPSDHIVTSRIVSHFLPRLRKKSVPCQPCHSARRPFSCTRNISCTMRIEAFSATEQDGCAVRKYISSGIPNRHASFVCPSGCAMKRPAEAIDSSCAC